MKAKNLILVLMVLSLVWGIGSPALAQTLPTDLHSPAPAAGLPAGAEFLSGPTAPNAPEDYPILKCMGTGITGDRADMRGIRFSVNQNFSSVEVRMVGSVSGSYSFTAELRRSTGFLGAAEASKTVSVSLSGTPSVTPYTPVTINFGEVAVSGTETFTLKFASVTGQGSLYFETFGIGNAPCANIEETTENNVADPTVRGDPAGFKVLASSPATLAIDSAYVSTPPDIDGKISFGEWQIANQIPFENGFITVLNDAIRLYVLIDVLDDNVNDSLRAMDYFWMTFDVNRNGVIDPKVDLNYGLNPQNGNMRYSYYLGPGQLTGIQPDTFSSKGRGFGCYFPDGSLTLGGFPSKINFHCSNHLVWEFGIDLAEIGAQPGGTARMGVRVASTTPQFANDIPANFIQDFSNLIQVSLAPRPGFYTTPNPNASISLDPNAIELTQAIQTRTNSEPLVQDKRTVGRVYVDVNGVSSSQPVKAYLYGSLGSVDLPGSPLAQLYNAPTSIDRSKLNNTANFLLPGTWDQGTVTFWSRAADTFGNQVSSTPFNLSFTSKEVPVYWIVPINTGSNASPVLVSNSEIASQESYMKTVYPVKDITFVRKNWEVIGPTTVANTINELNDYYNTVALAWLLSVLFGGGTPAFQMPDQIYGFPSSGGGISDPTWLGLNGRVARGYRGSSLEATMTHEVNHNLDRSSGGTWGRHTPYGCGATGPDPAWPYSNAAIQEVGFDTRLPWVSNASQVSVVPASFPDYMSYCQSGKLPTKWISPYRWENLFNTFTIPANTAMLQQAPIATDVYYITGQVQQGGSGGLNPIMTQLGIPSSGIAPGEYSLEVQNASGTPLSTTPFLVSFVNSEGDPVNTAYFNFQIPVVSGGARIVLKHNTQVLDTIVASAHPPTVSVVQPNGGENWSGVQTITWSAQDLDGDPLTFRILYTPDNGDNWYPVATNVSGTSLDVNTDTLPGGTQAKVRVIVSDGFNTAQDDSDGVFTLSEKGPEVNITTPSSGTQFSPGSQINFQGQATDLKDASIPDGSFVWTVDGNNDPVGTGPEVSAALSPGLHEITLTVTNSGNQVGQDTVQVFVGTRLYLPITKR